MKKSKLALSVPLILLSIFLVSCDASKRINKDFLYFQNGMDSLGAVSFKESPIQPNDLLSIQVFSKSLNQEQTEIFNIPNTGPAGGYQVNTNGNIEFPVIGRIKAAGYTRDQLASVLENKLSTFVKDPSVIVKFQQFTIKVLGEVKAPGIKNFVVDRVTILDAISMAGDLTDEGKRQNVMVIREESDGVRKAYTIDLRSADLFQSPVYQLQQNDVVYVAASRSKLRALSDKKDPSKAIQLGISLVSVATTLYLLIKR